MVKRPDIKVRKRLRITMCILYLAQIVVCTFPYFQDVRFNEDGLITMKSPFNMVILLFSVTSDMKSSVVSLAIMSMILILIPIIGFFFCALDKERNLKNIVSVICCFGGVFLIAGLLGNENVKYMSIGAVIAILLYIIIMFVTSIAMVMRLSKDSEEDIKKEEEKKRKDWRFD